MVAAGGTPKLTYCVALAMVALCASNAFAQPAPPPAPATEGGATPPPAAAPAAATTVAFLGLRPLTKKGGSENLPKLKEAQEIRATLESALAQVSRQTVLGHSQMAARLGGPYVVAMFKCSGQVACLTKLAQPLTKDGVNDVYTGDYYVDGGTYKFHLIRYSLDTGAIAKEITFDAPSDELQNADRWEGFLAPFVQAQIGKVQISIKPAGSICRLDGNACQFEADGKTVVLPIGEHQIEASKDGFAGVKQPVVVELGASKQVSIILQPKVDEGELRVPVQLGRRAPTLPVIRTDSPPTIDGELDDLVWGKSWVDPNFTQNFPEEGKPASERTEVRVLYDDDSVYIGVRCFDSQPDKIVARLTRRDRDIDSDKVIVDIGSKNDRASAYHFQVNAAGVQVDGIRFNDTDYSSDWDGRWYSEVSSDETGWTAELKIPLVTLRYNGDVNSFGFQVRRYIARRSETDEWSYVPRTAKGEVSYYGEINGMSGLNAKRLFDVLVYDSRRFIFRRNQGVFDGRDQASNFGADVKVGITPALTLNGTINPDFGTVEVDQVVLNLSTFETYFPEKRAFFLEGTEIFATPFKLFYSRRVGATPPSPSLGTLLEPLPDGRIWGAANISGLIGDRTSIGILDAVTSRQDATVERTMGGSRESLLVDPLANFGVVRLRREFGVNNSIGLLATSVNRIEPKGEAAPQPGDLCPVPYSTAFTFLIPPTPNKGRCTNDAYTSGADMNLRTKDGSWGASGQVLGSFIVHGPKRVIPDGTVIGSGSKGWGMVFDAGRYGGDHWLYTVHYRHASPELQINDAGYLAYANFREIGTQLTWRTTKATENFHALAVNASFNHRRDWNLKDNTNFSPLLSTSMKFKNFWTLNAGFSHFIRYEEIRETQDGARTQRNRGYYTFASVGTNPSKSTVLSLDFSTLGVYSGLKSYDWVGTISLKPTPALELDVLPAVSWAYGVARWVGTDDNGDGTRTYNFQDLNYKSFDLTMRGTYTFARTLSLQVYLQTFLANGTFSDPSRVVASGSKPLLEVDAFRSSPAPVLDGFRDGAVNVNMFLRWEYLPLSALWLVYTHNQGQTAYDPMTEGAPRLRFDRFSEGPATDTILIKLSYLWH
jgi:hypothetical protein